MRLVNVFSRQFNEKTTLYQVVQDGDVKAVSQIKTPFKPYFYSREQLDDYRIVGRENVKVANGEFVKNYTASPFDIKDLREMYKYKQIPTYEADISYSRRYMIDVQPDIGQDKLTKCFFDIEVDNPVTRFPDATKDGITCIAYWTVDKHNVMHIADFDGNEGELLKQFFKEIYNYSVIVGWNSKNFDIPFLIERCKQNSVSISWVNAFVMLDLMDLYKRFVTSYSKGQIVSSFSLDNVSHIELGEAKLDKSAIFEKNVEKLKEYNLKDAQLTYKIDEKLKLVDLIDAFSTIGGLLPQDCELFSTIITYIVMKRLNGKYVFNNFNSDEYKAGLTEKFQGAFVFEAPTGMIKGVGVFDFSSMYPNIIRDFNISFEIADGDREHEGVMPQIVSNFMELRKKYKKLHAETHDETYYVLQAGAKFLLASFYGVLGFPAGRLYKRELAERVTSTGRMLIQEASEFARGQGYETIYGDTDSMMIQAPLERCEQLGVDLNKHLSEKYSLKYSSMAFEKYFSKVFFYGKKKRYFGLIIQEDGKPADKVFVRGMESRRTDWCALAKEYEEELFEILLRKDVAAAEVFHRDFMNRLKGQPVEKFVIHKGLMKSIDDYKNLPPHARVATSSDYIGQKIPYIVTAYKKKIDKVARADNPTGIEPSFKYYLDKQLTPIYERLLEPLIITSHQKKLFG